MGLLRRILSWGSDEKEEAQPVELTPEQVRVEVDARVKACEEEALEEGGKRVMEVLSGRAEAMALVERLGRMEFDEELRVRMYRPVATSMPVYVKGMMEGLRRIGGEEPETFDGLSSFVSEAERALKAVQSVQLRQGRHLLLTFEREMAEIGGALNRVIDGVERLGRLVAGARAARMEGERLLAMLRELMDALEKGRAALKARAGLVEDMKGLEARVGGVEEELRRLEGSDEYKMALEMEEELRSLEQRALEIERRLKALFASIQRPLRKYARLLEKSGGGQAKEVKDCLSNPSAVLDKNLLVKVLKGLSTAVERGEIELDERERRKVSLAVEKVEKGEVERMLMERNSMISRRVELQGELESSQAIVRMRELGSELQELWEKVEELKARLEEGEPEKGWVETRRRELERRLSEHLGREVKLSLPDL